jgi:hypothetical protein
VRRVDAVTKTITTVAGTGEPGFNGDGIPATSAQLDGPEGVAVDAAGNVYIADSGNQRVRRVDAVTHLITTVAGDGDRSYRPSEGAALEVSLYGPNDVALDASGEHLYIASQYWVQRLSLAEASISTVAGTGVYTSESAADDLPATDAWIDSVFGIALDASNNLYLTDFWNQRVRRVDADTNMISTIAGNGTWEIVTDPKPALDSAMTYPYGIVVDHTGNIYVVDGVRVRRIDADTQMMTTVAGTDKEGFYGDGGAAREAWLQFPMGIALGPTGDLFIADAYNERIRMVSETDIVVTPTLPPSSTTTTTTPREKFVYVALGDSYQSGEGAAFDLRPTSAYLDRGYENGTNYPNQIGPQEDTYTQELRRPGNSCHRALLNYAKINRDAFAPGAEVVLVDRTCSGATIQQERNDKNERVGKPAIVGDVGVGIDAGSQVDQALTRLRSAGLTPEDVDLVTVGMGRQRRPIREDRRSLRHPRGHTAPAREIPGHPRRDQLAV